MNRTSLVQERARHSLRVAEDFLDFLILSNTPASLKTGLKPRLAALRHTTTPATPATERKQAQNPRLAALRHSYASSAHPAHLHTCRKPVPKTGAERAEPRSWVEPGGLEARPSEPHTSTPHTLYTLYTLYTLHTILFYKRYAECAEYAETQKSSTEPRFHGASASASYAHPAHLDISIERAKSSAKYHLHLNALHLHLMFCTYT